jgi:hypothetical protein
MPFIRFPSIRSYVCMYVKKREREFRCLWSSPLLCWCWYDTSSHLNSPRPFPFPLGSDTWEYFAFYNLYDLTKLPHTTSSLMIIVSLSSDVHTYLCIWGRYKTWTDNSFQLPQTGGPESCKRRLALLIRIVHIKCPAKAMYSYGFASAAVEVWRTDRRTDPSH